MKIRAIPNPNLRRAGYALLLTLAFAGIAIIALAATVSRTLGNSKLNNRSNDYASAQNAAEAAVEKVVARVGYDFQNYGLGGVTQNLGIYRTNAPCAAEDSYWTNFVFSDGQNHIGQTYVGFVSNYSGALPSQYPGLFTTLAPIYRIISNARPQGSQVTAAVQEDVLLALVPITQYAIFYNGLLEFSTCADMTVNGRVHANGSIYTGTGASLTFNNTVTTTATISSPYWNGQGPDWKDTGTYNGKPASTTNVPTVTLSIGTTNVHSVIDQPPAGESPTSSTGSARLYNQAQVVLQISNSAVRMTLQNSVNDQVPGADPSPIVISSLTNLTALATNFPFLTLTNSFTDQRENKTILTTQIDVGKYARWISTNSRVLTKFPNGSGTYPTILYVADNRTTTSSQLAGVRLTNGIAPPVNGGLGFSVATPNPLYVIGNYNCTNSSFLGTTNTSASVPCAFMSDALTILSSNWTDSASAGSYKSRNPVDTTVNAAVLTGIVPSTDSSSTGFSGGVHNLPRLLEDWNSPVRQLTLNTSIMSLYNSTRATHMFVNPGTYYDPPSRLFSFDLNYLSASKQPPGIPCALVLIRLNWAAPPPNCVTYNVTP
jgi:hypothetical protein